MLPREQPVATAVPEVEVAKALASVVAGVVASNREVPIGIFRRWELASAPRQPASVLSVRTAETESKVWE